MVIVQIGNMLSCASSELGAFYQQPCSPCTQEAILAFCWARKGPAVRGFVAPWLWPPGCGPWLWPPGCGPWLWPPGCGPLAAWRGPLAVAPWLWPPGCAPWLWPPGCGPLGVAPLRHRPAKARLKPSPSSLDLLALFSGALWPSGCGPPWLWPAGCGPLAVAPAGCAPLAVLPWLWPLGCGRLAVAPWLWPPGCAPWLWPPGCGPLGVAPLRHRPAKARLKPSPSSLDLLALFSGALWPSGCGPWLWPPGCGPSLWPPGWLWPLGCGRLAGSGSPEEEEALLEAPSTEVARGFLANFVVGVIDDAKQSAVIAAYSSTVKLQLQDVGYAAAMVVFLMRELSQSSSQTGRWLGKTFDRSKAYKQLAVFPGHQKHAIVGFPAKGSWKFYKSFSLPYGCTGRVYVFVRISQAIWFIATKFLHAATSHYFDDFPTLERAEGCRVLSLAFSAVLDILGWIHAKEGDKALNFAEAFDLLGVTFNLVSIPSGLLEVSNKVSRIEQLCQLLDHIFSDGAISTTRASEIQGLLNFAVGYYTGKSLKHLVSAFMPFAETSHNAKRKDLQDLCSLEAIQSTVRVAPCYFSQMALGKQGWHLQGLSWWMATSVWLSK
eukprot:s209_g20.t1